MQSRKKRKWICGIEFVWRKCISFRIQPNTPWQCVRSVSFNLLKFFYKRISIFCSLLHTHRKKNSHKKLVDLATGGGGGDTALVHLVITCEMFWKLGVCKLTFKSHVVFNSKLLGFKSRCNTLAEWMYLRPRKIW